LLRPFGLVPLKACGISKEHIYLTTGVKMKSLLAKIIKWKRENSVKYNTHNRNSEFSSQLFDAIYNNNFELAKNLIDGGQVDVNIKNDCVLYFTEFSLFHLIIFASRDFILTPVVKYIYSLLMPHVTLTTS
jgi:hypothetical protein